MNHQINIDEAIAIAKEYHLECDYCIIPEADYILKENTSFLNESISAGVKC